MRNRFRPRGVNSLVERAAAASVRAARWRTGLLVATMAIAVAAISAGVMHGQQSCPCSVWTSATSPGAVASDSSAVELGMKFQSDTAGFITGIRFFKYSQNTGTHFGNLWTTA